MNTKENYTKPEIELVEIEIDVPVMNASLEGETDGPANSHKRRFWRDEE